MAAVAEYTRGQLVQAACRGDVKQIEQCLSRHADVDEMEIGRTALMHAVYENKTAAVKLLLERKANVHYRTKAGVFLLQLAAQNGNKDVCEMLLRAGASKLQRCNGKTATQWAVEYGHPDLAKFIENAHYVSLCSLFVCSFLFVEICCLLFHRVVLLFGGWQYIKGDLIRAAVGNDITKLKEWLALGANVDETCTNGNTSLCYMASNGNKEAVELLLANKANVNYQGTYGNFPLISAVHGGFRDVCEVLLRAGANKKMEQQGQTAAQAAAQRGHAELALLIQNWGDGAGAGAAPSSVSTLNRPSCVDRFCVSGERCEHCERGDWWHSCCPLAACRPGTPVIPSTSSNRISALRPVSK